MTVSGLVPTQEQHPGGRFYLARVVGAGTEADPYRPKLHDHGVSFSASSAPAGGWTVCYVPDPQAKVPVDPDLYPLPAGAPDDTLAQQPPLELTRIVEKATTGLGVVPDVSPARTIRELVEECGREHDPAFDAAVLNPDWRA